MQGSKITRPIPTSSGKQACLPLREHSFHPVEDPLGTYTALETLHWASAGPGTVADPFHAPPTCEIGSVPREFERRSLISPSNIARGSQNTVSCNAPNGSMCFVEIPCGTPTVWS